ncbi:MAG: DsbA family protein [Micrococcales bacterium]|nr:DsbA family protein [Micrococcales bacterium]
MTIISSDTEDGGEAVGAQSPAGVSNATVTVWGDFTCPWSYLAWQRTELLADAGVPIDWRTVEHDPWHHLTPDDVSDRHQALQSEMPEVLGHLLPGERLPYTLPRGVPFTGAATSAYAEAYAAGVARPVRRRLFGAFWRDGVDLNNARVLQVMLVADLRRGTSTSELVQHWGYAVDVTGGPITAQAWQAIRDWREQWQEASGVTPTLLAGGGDPVVGVAAVDWLGAQVRERGLLRDDRGHDHPAA